MIVANQKSKLANRKSVLSSPPLHNMNIRFLLLFYILPPASIETCSDAVCQDDNLTVRFPFRIQQSQQQPKSCGYPGFDVSCSNQGQTQLKLPSSGGEFNIRGIDYAAQELWINDPENCLPKRILSLNLTGSPFSGVYYQDFSFFNCSSEYLKYRYTPIACLSNSNYTVFATSSRSVFRHLLAVCSFIATVRVPVQQPFYEHVSSSDLSDDLRLSWDSPPCGKCESRGGRCGFQINSTADIACSYFPSQGISKGARYAIGIGIGVPAMLGLIGMLYYVGERCRRVETYVGPEPQSAMASGLDGPTIESYPKQVVGEAEEGRCPICLSEYRPNETLKTIPACLHSFHSHCIDAWLPLNASCPLCRKISSC
ncbi:putative RING-H2 finger protein ATL21A [Prosopis cineraria]|uniref:putative RING-H2 finger protein ATL21A n=1 Tax=Prosopis cineraria TaxID=364024 RepID=UPI00240F5D89|nr:putative RING-H2 finger protein ATL21A [Prosopis cineraria]